MRERTASRTAAKTARIRQSCLGSAEHAPRSTAAPGPGADLRLTAMPLTSDWRPTIVRSPTTARSMNLYAHKAAINARLDPLVDRLAHAGLLAAAGTWSCFPRRREAGTARSACSARASGCSRRAPAARSPRSASSGSRKVLPKGAWLPRRAPVEVRFGAPLRLGADEKVRVRSRPAGSHRQGTVRSKPAAWRRIRLTLASRGHQRLA